MTSPVTQNALGATETDLMTRYGITRVPTDWFLYKSYRYTNLADAIAQAKRDGLPA
ncbi:acetyl-CoA acetyltransferase [Sphingomonas oligoaromativorans]|nr:acetyl-CoA acetyltransferase [Sphingomonas oligoaromativorans]